MKKIILEVDNKPLNINPMKKRAYLIAAQFGCTAAYSGRTKTMYIDHADEAVIDNCIREIRLMLSADNKVAPFKVDVAHKEEEVVE